MTRAQGQQRPFAIKSKSKSKVQSETNSMIHENIANQNDQGVSKTKEAWFYSKRRTVKNRNINDIQVGVVKGHYQRLRV